MKLRARIQNIVKSNLSDMIACAENPEKLLQQCISDMQEQAAKARREVAHAIAAEKKLARIVTAAAADAERLEAAAAASAEQASRGDGDAAPDEAVRDAVRTHLAARRRADDVQRQWNQQLESVGVLKAALGELQAKIDEARRRKDVLVARKRVAQAKRDVHTTLSGIAETNSFLDMQAFEAFDRVAEQVETTEAEAEAAAEVCLATIAPGAEHGGTGRYGVTEAEIDAALAALQHPAPESQDA